VHQQLSILLSFLHSYHIRFYPNLFASAPATISLSRNEDEDPILRDSEAARYIHILLNKDILDVDRMRGNRAIPARSRRGISTPLGDKAGRAVSRADLPSVKLINPGILILCNSRTAWSNPSDRSSFGHWHQKCGSDGQFSVGVQ